MSQPWTTALFLASNSKILSFGTQRCLLLDHSGFLQTAGDSVTQNVFKERFNVANSFEEAMSLTLDGNVAFLWDEGAMLQEVYNYCRLVQVKRRFSAGSFAFATSKKFPYTGIIGHR